MGKLVIFSHQLMPITIIAVGRVGKASVRPWLVSHHAFWVQVTLSRTISVERKCMGERDESFIFSKERVISQLSISLSTAEEDGYRCSLPRLEGTVYTVSTVGKERQHINLDVHQATPFSPGNVGMRNRYQRA